MNLLTVIVPVYNTQALVGRCIKSIQASTYSNLEILLVDDGSTDNSLEICRQYAAEDHRIKVSHKENGGVSSARNLGMQMATGEYIAFCDSDDMVPEKGYQSLMEKADHENADLVQGTIRRTREESGDVRLWKRCEKASIKTKIIGFQGAMIRTKIIKENQICFPEFKVGEDNSFMIQVYRFAEKIAYVDEIVYDYLIRSSTSSAGASAIQIKDYPHYLDELRWREWTLQYINSSDKLHSAYKHQLGDFCPVIDGEWLNYSEEERKQCFDALRDIVASIDWMETDVNPKEFLQVEPDKLLNMDEKQYTGHIKFVYKIIQPIKAMLGR